MSLYVLVKFAQFSIGFIHKFKTQGVGFPSFRNIHQANAQVLKFSIIKDQLHKFPNLITLLIRILNVDVIEHVSTKQHPQVLNVQPLINETNYHALEAFNVLNINVILLMLRKWMSNLMKHQVPLVAHSTTIANT